MMRKILIYRVNGERLGQAYPSKSTATCLVLSTDFDNSQYLYVLLIPIIAFSIYILHDSFWGRMLFYFLSNVVSGFTLLIKQTHNYRHSYKYIQPFLVSLTSTI